jgi:DNA-directed RNA polymerase subunit RPC12/RpoP
MDKIKFNCPKCKKGLAFPAEKAKPGLSAKCPGCGHRMRIPTQGLANDFVVKDRDIGRTVERVIKYILLPLALIYIVSYFQRL